VVLAHFPRRLYNKEEAQKSRSRPIHVNIAGWALKNCPTIREEYKRRNNKIHHAHVVEDDEPPKKLTKEEIEDYVLFFSLSGSVTPGEDTWIIDSGASKHMTGQK
jgi:hypothetical protein